MLLLRYSVTKNATQSVKPAESFTAWILAVNCCRYFCLACATLKPTGIQRKQWGLIIHLETYLALQRWSKGLVRAVMRSAVGKQSKHSQDHYSQVRLRLGSGTARRLRCWANTLKCSFSQRISSLQMPLDMSLASTPSPPTSTPAQALPPQRSAGLCVCAAVNTPVSHHVICGRPAGRALSHSGWVVIDGGGGRGVKGFALCQFFMFVRGGSRAYTSKHVAGNEEKKTYFKLFLAAFTSKSLSDRRSPTCCLCSFIIRLVQFHLQKKGIYNCLEWQLTLPLVWRLHFKN